MNHRVPSLAEVGSGDSIGILALLLDVDPERVAVVEDVETVPGPDPVAAQRKQSFRVGNLRDQIDPFQVEGLLVVGSSGGPAAEYA